MNTNYHTRQSILELFKRIGTPLGIDYLQIHSPVNQVQLQQIVDELLQDGELKIVDKYHWQAVK